jgi:hypothetical protein
VQETVTSEMLLHEFPCFYQISVLDYAPCLPMRASVLDRTLAQALSVTTK